MTLEQVEQFWRDNSQRLTNFDTHYLKWMRKILYQQRVQNMYFEWCQKPLNPNIITKDELTKFYQSNKSRLSVYEPQPEQWLKLLIQYRKMVIELCKKFSDDKTFEQHIQLIGSADPIQHQRSDSLTNVRNTIINLMRKNYTEMNDLSKTLIDVANRMTKDDVNCLSVVGTSWKIINIGETDQGIIRINQDRKLLNSLSHFSFEEETNITNLSLSREENRRLHYLKIGFGQEQKKDDQTISENDFASLTDRLLMFMAGENGNINMSNEEDTSIGFKIN